jgi:hypothetical protein
LLVALVLIAVVIILVPFAVQKQSRGSGLLRNGLYVGDQHRDQDGDYRDHNETAGYSIQLVVPQLSVSAKARCTSVVCGGLMPAHEFFSPVCEMRPI